ncbi:condensation domain-containing protein [Streptomyces sp. ITFR-16]|uniref:condensation domain-containing protein n=1 Tax=Streptomyces sp. ITFR-16 TaxID=3075198 RepID=UPI00288B96D9|nr:condensation domain-containing protein [Streptomyces sp. ITFR-16]WNI27205.1 condensation domain-containing protein [Streptomyces sp. ITFR-16]
MLTPTPSEALLDLAADVMGLDARTLAPRAAGSPFITLGGTYDRAMRLRLRAGETLGLGLEPHRLMGPAPLADVLDRAVPVPAPSPRLAHRPAWRPLLPGQSAALAAEREAGAHAVHRVLSAELTGPLDVPALRTAIDALCARHEGLRTAFAPFGQGLARRVLDRHPAPLVTLRHLPPDAGVEPVAAAHLRLTADLRRLAGQPGSPPLAFVLAALGPDRHLLSFVHHEAVADGFSAALVWRELLDGYHRVTHGLPPDRSPAPAPDTVLPDGAPSGVPAGSGGHEGGTVPRFRTERLGFGLDTALRDAVDRTARRAGVPHSGVLLAAWALALGRGSGAETVAVDVELPRHPGAAPVRSVAPCAASVPVSCALEGTTDYFLRGVACAFGEALAAAEAPAGGEGRGTAHALAPSAPARVLFAARDEWLPASCAYGPLGVRFHHGRLGAGPAQAALSVLRWREDPLLCLDFAPSVIERASAVRLVAEVQQTLRALVRARSWAPVDDLLPRSGARGTAPFSATGTVPLPLC